jgi:hypothetical protein
LTALRRVTRKHPDGFHDHHDVRPGQGGAGGGVGVERIGLAAGSAGASVRAVDLHHGHTCRVQVAGQSGAVGAGALDPDRGELAVVTDPGE